MTDQNQLNWQRTNLDNIEQAWDGDLWDRKRLGVQLTNYVDRLNCGAVLALDARWGEGKTWFVRHWKKHLEENHNVIYLDAFANDYLEDPFLVISSEITSCLSKDGDVDQSHINTFKEKAAAAYHALLPSLPKVLLTLGLNLISGGVLGTLAQQIHESGEKVIESATDQLGDKIKESIEAKIENHEADKNTLHAFKQELAKLAEELDRPLVFIIDELDRCRPDFAIRLIERIKHFFDIPKIVFVLVMNKPQLLQSVKSFYGYDSEMNGDYLEKFVDFTIKFAEINDSKMYEYIIKEQLFRIDELESVEIVNQFYFLVLGLQLLKKLNSRELIKKINQYALLRTNNNMMNMLLMVLLFDQTLSTNLLNFNSIVDILFTYFRGDDRYVTKEHFIRTKLSSEFNINQVFFLDYLEKIQSFDRNYNTAGQREDKEIVLKRFLEQYSIKKLENSAYFIRDWKQYIQNGVFGDA
ncbi:P-loop ATPase [Acinetobacter sp. 1207_04]|uniref:KAP family P-loop NTPase fold protein n=1 Tax=Acinetobacter sp. 1207_04 TaxID=2604449 RepID=UPI00405838F3